MRQHEILGKKQIVWIASLTAVVVLSALYLCYVLISRGEHLQQVEIQRYLEEISRQTSAKANQRIEFNLNKLKSISESLPFLKEEEVDSYLHTLEEKSDYEWIVLLDENKDAVVKGKTLYLHELPAIQKALQGSDAVNDSLIKGGTNSYGALYAVPYVDAQNKKHVVAGWVPQNTMKLLQGTDTFDGSGFSHVVSGNGDFILHSHNKNAQISDTNYLSGLYAQATMMKGYHVEAMRTDMQNGKSGYLRFHMNNGEERILTYSPLKKTDWYLLSIVSPAAYSRGLADYIVQNTWMVLGGTLLMFCMLACLVSIIIQKKNREILNIAFVDPVTKGFTQPRFDLEVEKLLKNAQSFAYVSLDIRRFKLINDAFGSEEGNRVLQHVYACIRQQLREGEAVSRIHADHFNLLLRTMDKEQLEQRLQLISKNVNAFNAKRQQPYYLTLSCGTYLADNPHEDPVSIRDKAIAARKHNHGEHEHAVCSNMFFSDLNRLKMLREKELENSMEAALKNGEFLMYLQPKVSLKTGRVAGAEALARWQSADRGMIMPNDFIPLFERNDFIRKLDLYIFEQACKRLRTWIDEGSEVIPISVNLSRNHLYQPDFLNSYRMMKERYRIPPHLLEIELTETVVFENLSRLKQVIDELHALGFLCSLDDFGSGYSSLNVLQNVTVDVLKLDRFFFQDMDDRGFEVINAVIQLAKQLGMTTVAEGVESLSQVKLLQEMNCDMVQGFVFGKPQPADVFDAMRKEHPCMYSE